jgi:chitinase
VIAPTTPGNLRLTSVNSPSSLSLAWDRSTDRWAFTYDIFDEERGFIAGASYFSISTRLRHLDPGGRYNLTIRARDNAGNVSGPSNTLTVTMPSSTDTEAPSVPSNLTVEDFDDFCGSLILRWGRSTDNDGASPIEYEIFRDGAFFTLATDTDFVGIYAPNGTSTWTVKAVDRSGNTSAASNAVTETVLVDTDFC